MESADSPQSESKEEETAVQEQQVDSPIIGNSLYIQGPENWPSDVVYVCSNVWDEFAMQKWEKYVDGSQMGSYVEPFRDPVTGTCGLIATKPLVNSSWLGEYTGSVQKGTKHPKDNKGRGYRWFHEDELSQYYVNAFETGNEARFIRSEQNSEKINICFQRMWIDGTIRIFLEVLKDIQENDELVAEVDEKVKEIDEMTVDGFDSQQTYEHVDSLSWDELDEEDIRYFSERRTLSELVEIKRIEDASHPCCGQFGLFAKKKLKKNSYLGEYSGKVIANADESVYTSKYLVDFSIPGVEDCASIWIDAAKYGNETRFINDNKGTAKEPNVNFKRMWIAGSMRVFAQITADVQPGEELYTEYGDRYWNNVNL